MKVPYSPYNKTYKYISLQNQLAHVKNLQNTSGITNSNISFMSPMDRSYVRNRKSDSYSAHKSFSESRTFDCSTPAKLQEAPRVLHMNQSFNKRKDSGVNLENQRLARKLMETKCRVITTA